MRDKSRGAHVKYRPDIDGLRAVAVLLVLADHLGTRLSGGYIGVDVFFVISGYLISANILSEMATGRFSLVNFYERRVRRIFPALLVMLAVVSVLAYRFFLISEMIAYAHSLLAALFSGSNILFWREAGYFDAPSELKPLLHTWSLAVEEQFYIIFPLLLLVLRKWWSRRLKAAIIALAIVSLAAAALVVRNHPEAAFFLAPLRAWELLAGTIVSQHYLPPIRSALSRNVASALGLLLIFWPALVYSSFTTFPGVAAIPPVLGAALVIAAGESGSSLVGRGLALGPVRFIGLISYSLYLWHWPIIVFQRTSSILFPEGAATSRSKLVVALVSILAGGLSWLLVEQPFRKGRWKPGRTAVFAINGVALTVMVAVGGWMLATRGLPKRFPVEARAMAAYTNDQKDRVNDEGTCFLLGALRVKDIDQQRCLPLPDGRPSLMILGDSHGAALWPGLLKVYSDREILRLSSSGCLPVWIDEAVHNASACQALRDYAFNEFLLHRRIDTLLLTGRWTEADLPDLGRTLKYLSDHGIHTILVGPVPEFHEAEPRVIALALRAGRPGEIEQHQSTGPQQTDRRMAELARTTWHVPYVSIFADICQPQCPVYAAPGVPLLFDTDHLTTEASILLAGKMREKKQL